MPGHSPYYVCHNFAVRNMEDPDKVRDQLDPPDLEGPKGPEPSSKGPDEGVADLDFLDLDGPSLMDLGIDLGVRTVGRPRRPYIADFTRDLGPADIAALNAAPRGGTVPALKRIHASHHALARCLASGMRQNQVALVTGYTQARISTLMQDDAFKALVNDYQSEAKGAYADLAERMAGVSFDAIEVLHDRLQDNPEGFSIGMLFDIVRGFADRTGYGPGQDVNVRVSAEMIDRPPRESAEEWEKRRMLETAPPGKLN
jgi:hypothetical protein